MTAVTPRLSRLIRAGSLRALQDTLIGMMGGGDALWAADTFILVPTRAAAEQLRRTVEDRVLPERGALAWPAVGTRSDWYQALRDRAPAIGSTLTGVEREAILARVAREVSLDGIEPPFALRPALTAEMLALYDFIRRQGRAINDFERHLVDEGTHIVKFFLWISRDEQKRRLQERLSDPEKNWKFSEADLKERGRWDEYIEAFNLALERCGTDHAPWWIVPANRKWFRDWMIARVLRGTLEGFGMQWPKAQFDPTKVRVD